MRLCMSLYHSFRKIGKKKEISDRPRSCPHGSDSRILYAYIKTGMQKSIPILLVRQAGIDRLTALRLQAASSPHTVRHRITRCQRLHGSFWPRSCPLGSDSRILYAHIKTGMQKASLFCWCARRESNPRPSHSECATLSPELLAQINI